VGIPSFIVLSSSVKILPVIHPVDSSQMNTDWDCLHSNQKSTSSKTDSLFDLIVLDH
jgi:hypothetical protein